MALLLAAVLATSVTATVADAAKAAPPSKRPPVQQEKVVPHTDFPLVSTPAAGMPARPLVGTSWPAAGEADVNLPSDADVSAAAPHRAGGLPVALSRQPAASAGGFHVRVADPDTATRVGVTGVVVSVTPAGASTDAVSVGVDYSGFANAAGADFGSRLQLVALPACALTTPELAACRVQTPLPSTNDTATSVVSAKLTPAPSAASSPAASSPMVVAAAAGPGGPGGTYQASSLAPSETWSVANNSGAFTWSYPLVLPPAATGADVVPKVALSYNSASVDGRTAATNGQSSWIGQGWDYTPGFIERTYRSCSNDTSLPAEAQTGDLCWAGQIVTMSLGGKSTALVRDDVTGTWHGVNDNGSRIELVTGAVNGVNNGEHWKITTTDGVQYFFGRNRPPGYTNQEETSSVWTVPVYGPRGGDPCNNPAGFASSWCAQAWRWNLDYVEDPHGNATAYYYNQETNFYGPNNGTGGVGYTRGGTLKRIDYGLRDVAGSIYGAVVPNQVVFDVAERCIPSSTFTCDPSQFTAANAKSWPDTPQDQQCLPGGVCNIHSPTFWSTKRLTMITTQYNPGSGPVKVDSYQLTQQFPSIGDPELWLDSITRTGYTGAAITMPPIKFTGQLMDNRVYRYNNQPAMAHWRVTNIASETGTSINLTYSTAECTSSVVPVDVSQNTLRCYPVYWTPRYYANPILDFFHKYVTAKVEVQDINAVSPTQVTTYNYVGTPAWHFDDNEIVKPAHRSYGQFRGYSQVETRLGNPSYTIDAVPDIQTLTRATYFRGMDGDTLPGGGRRSATVTNSLGEVVVDANPYASSVREKQEFNGDGGAQLSSTITDPITVATTATRNRAGLTPLTANVVADGATRALTNLAAGGVRTATTTSRYDSLGRPVAKTESGDGVPDLCTRVNYADNTASWIRDRASETITSQQVCPPDGVTPAPIVADVRTFYDGQATLGALPGAGDLTRTDTATDNNVGALAFATSEGTTFDAAGRPTSSTDALGRVTRTDYTPADGGGVLTKKVVTNPKGQTSITEFDPARGSPTGEVDIAGRRTDATYDGLGRLTAVWKPGQSKRSNPATATYDYLLRTNGPLAVTSKQFVDYGTGTNYITTVNLYDAFGQLRQTQADAIGGGRVCKDIFYDSHGWARTSNNRYYTTGAPATTMISVASSAVNDRTITTYDGHGRTTQATAYKGLTATWSTNTIYGGDRTTTIPPQGGVTSTTITDARGEKTELRQYTTAPTVTGSVVSGGTYQASSYHYTATGRRDRITDTAGTSWTFSYDFLGRKVSQTDPDSGTSTTSYDLAGQVASTTDARGQTLAYDYDSLGRKITEYSGSTAGPKLASWEWDTTTGGVGKLASSARYTPTGTYTNIIYDYDGQGNPTGVGTQIPAGDTGLAGTYTTQYAYTTTGQVTSVEPAGGGGLPGEAIGITYNSFGKPNATLGYFDYVTATTYTPFGEVAQYSLSSLNNAAWLTYDRDAQTRRLTNASLAAQKATAQVDSTAYTYDPAGNITRTVNTQGAPNAAPVRTECFTYDTLNRLTEAWTATDNCAAAPATATIGGPNPYWTTWTFTPTGLRDSQTRHTPTTTTPDTKTTYTYPTPTSPQPHTLTNTTTTGPTPATTNYSYDPAGNTTNRTLPTGAHNLTWDNENRLATITTPAGTTSYTYDADGNQLIRRDPTTTTLYLPTEEFVRNNTTGVVTGTRYYTHNGATIALRVGNTNPKYVAADQHNTATVTLDSVGYAITRRALDPYGNPLGATQGGPWPDNHGFLDKPVNTATGLTDIGARKYDATTGRFISVDPILDATNPQSMTGYTYGSNNPITFSDPSGLMNCGPDNVGCGGIRGDPKPTEEERRSWWDSQHTAPSPPAAAHPYTYHGRYRGNGNYKNKGGYDFQEWTGKAKNLAKDTVHLAHVGVNHTTLFGCGKANIKWGPFSASADGCLGADVNGVGWTEGDKAKLDWRKLGDIKAWKDLIKNPKPEAEFAAQPKINFKSIDDMHGGGRSESMGGAVGTWEFDLTRPKDPNGSYSISAGAWSYRTSKVSVSDSVKEQKSGYLFRYGDIIDKYPFIAGAAPSD